MRYVLACRFASKCLLGGHKRTFGKGPLRVRFTHISRHRSALLASPLSPNSGHCCHSPNDGLWNEKGAVSTQRRVTFQTSLSSVPELRITLETGQKRCRSAFTFSNAASLASVVPSITRRIFGNCTSTSSSNCAPRRSKVDSASIVMALSSTPCFFAHLWVMTLVQAISAATIVSVGVGPMFVPSRSLGSSTTALTSRTEISVREWVGQLARIRCVTLVFSLTVTMMLLLLYLPSL